MKKMSDESPLVEHHTEHHPEKKELRFKLEMMKSFKTPLERQVYEGVRISQSKAIPINRKGEWGQNVPPRFKIHEGQGQTSGEPDMSKGGAKRKNGGRKNQAISEGTNAKRLRTDETEALTTGAAKGPTLGPNSRRQSQFSLERGKGREGVVIEEGTDAGTLDPAHGAEISSQDSGDRSSSGGECEVNMGKSNISKEED